MRCGRKSQSASIGKDWNKVREILVAQTITAEISSKAQVARNVFAFELSVPAEAFQPAEAGSHIDVHVSGGKVRQYSLVRPTEPGDDSYRIAVLREPDGRGGSLALCDGVEAGDQIDISLPRNHFRLDAGQTHYCLIGAGIGVTPILSMAHALYARGASFEIHLCARSPDHLAFHDEIRSAPWAGRVHYHFSEEAASGRLDLAAFLPGLDAGTQVYACGPERFLDELSNLTRGWPIGRVRQERFSAAPDETGESGTGNFDVAIKSTGQVFSVGSDESILEVLEANGFEIDVSCTEGVCGTCLTGVVEGEPVHRDSCLYEEEQAEGKIMAVCVSRAKPGSTLVLDL